MSADSGSLSLQVRRRQPPVATRVEGPSADFCLPGPAFEDGAPAEASSPAAPLDTLLRVLSLQRAGCGFDFDEQTADALDLEPGRVASEAAKLDRLPSDLALRLVWTATVLELLESRYREDAPMWRTAVAKS